MLENETVKIEVELPMNTYNALKYIADKLGKSIDKTIIDYINESIEAEAEGGLIEYMETIKQELKNLLK